MPICDDLLAQTAAVSLALLLTGSLFAHPCLSAPAEPRLDTRPWHHPCGTNKQQLSGAPLTPVRHPAMKALKRVRTQIQIASNHYAKEKTNIEMLYQELKKEFKDVISYSWLPDMQLRWFEKDVKCLEKDRRIAQALPELHSSLQKYLVTIEEVNRFPAAIHEPHEMSKIRKKLIFDVSKEIKKWLCEVETALISSNLPIPVRTSEDIIPRHDLNRWHSDPNHTTSLIQAWGVLEAYHKFTEEWKKIFKMVLVKMPPSCKKQPGKKGKQQMSKKPVSQAAVTIPAAAASPAKPTLKKRKPTPKSQ